VSTAFAPIEIPPGVVSTATKKMRSTNWSEVNLLRWREGLLMPVGGQSPLYSGTPFASRCRRIHGWYDLDQIYHIAYLCEEHIYVDTGGEIEDITPLSGLSAVPYNQGDYSDGPYSGDVTYGLAPPESGLEGGYGDLDYSEGTYGTPRPYSTVLPVDRLPDCYSLDNFGSVLYAMTSADTRLLMWDPAVGGHAVEQPASSGRGPVPRGRCFVITPERFVMIFGSFADGTTSGGPSPIGGGQNRFAWCDQENPGAWDYSSVTSQAGFLDIEPSSPIVTAISTRSGTLIWTGKNAYVSLFLGLPYVYNYSELAKNCTPWSPQSVVNTSSMALWMSEQGMFSFDGTSILPLACKIRPWIDESIGDDPTTLANVRGQSFACHVENFNEFWWFFPQDQNTSGTPYNTRCALYNYKDGWWSEGRMTRSAGITASYTSHTIMADGTLVFRHEDGLVYANADPPFAETFDMTLTSGARLTTVKQLIPDVEGDVGNLLYSLFYRNSRSQGAPELRSPLVPVRNDGYVDFRVTGRDIRLRIDVASGIIKPWTLGQHLIDAVVRGDR
jgi:hypothetical protein